MAIYHDICQQVENLTADEQLCLLEDLAATVRHRTLVKPKRNIRSPYS